MPSKTKSPMETTLTQQQPLLPTLPKQSLIAAYSNLATPDSILSNIACRTYEDVLLSNHATIGELAALSEQWRMFTLAYISVALTKYLDFISRRNTMDDYQVAETATLILEEYPNLKVDDIALFFRQCRLSRFGKLYDLNGAVLLDWLHEYQQQRNAAQYNLYCRQEQERKDEEERRRQAQWEALTPEQKAETRASWGTWDIIHTVIILGFTVAFYIYFW